MRGAGLGLSINKAYVEMLGGNIRLNSKEGEGSTFIFNIPYNQEHIAKESNTTTEKQENSGVDPGVSATRVLIVEDDDSSSLYLRDVLKSFCKDMVFAKNGKEAIEKLKNNKDFDIVLMDLKMPEMDGYEATKKIREFNKDVVIIAQTAFALEGDREKALAAGCDDYVAKPIRKEVLFEIIGKYF